MKVECEINYEEREGEDGIMRECTTATCTRCGHETVSWGTGEASVKRCLVMLRNECPRGEENFYLAEDF